MIFEREDWTLFRTLTTLSQKAGVPLDSIGKLVCKEITDNALDAAGEGEKKAGCRFDNRPFLIQNRKALPSERFSSRKVQSWTRKLEV